MGVDDSRRPGFDDWVSMKGQGEANDPELNDNGQRAPVKGYVTDIFTDRALAFVERPRQKPFPSTSRTRRCIPTSRRRPTAA